MLRPYHHAVIWNVVRRRCAVPPGAGAMGRRKRPRFCNMAPSRGATLHPCFFHKGKTSTLVFSLRRKQDIPLLEKHCVFSKVTVLVFSLWKKQAPNTRPRFCNIAPQNGATWQKQDRPYDPGSVAASRPAGGVQLGLP